MMLCCLFLRSNHCFWGLLMTRRSIWRGMPLLAQLMDCVPDMIGVSPCLWENNPTKAKLCCPLLIEGTQRLEKRCRDFLLISFLPPEERNISFQRSLCPAGSHPVALFRRDEWPTCYMHWKDTFTLACEISGTRTWLFKIIALCLTLSALTQVCPPDSPPPACCHIMEEMWVYKLTAGNMFERKARVQ